MIQTEELRKRFGETLAVDRLSFQVNEGEVFGFLGPNGAGKTTTVRMLTSLISPTTGSAVVNGFQLGKADKEIRRSVGILTETPGMYDNLNAEYNLRIFANLYEVKDVCGQVEKYLRMLGLWDRRFDEAGTFSKGMRSKNWLSPAPMLHEPRIQKNLNFHYMISSLPINIMNYIIIHELVHLIELNHSDRFWDLVRLHDPNYKEHIHLLKIYNDVLCF